MKKFIIPILFLFSVQSWAGPVPGFQQPQLTVGGRVFTDITNLIMLYCWSDNTTTHANCTFRKQDGSGGYTPSGSKTFRAAAFKIFASPSAAAASLLLTLSYTTNDVGFGSNTSLTGSTNIGGAAGIVLGTLGVENVSEGAIDFVVPNAKYLTMVNAVASASLTLMVFGYEQ